MPNTTSHIEQTRIKQLRISALVIAGVVLLLGLVSLVGWIFGLGFLKAPVFWEVPINPLSSIHFTLLAFVLFSQQTNRLEKVGRYITYFILTTSTYIIISRTGLVSFQIDTVFFDLSENAIEPFKGGMSLFSAIDFTLASIALLLSNNSAKVVLRQLICVAILLIATIPLVVYVNKVPETEPFFLMAPFSAVGFGLTALALLLVKPNEGIAREIVKESSGGFAARYLVPIAVIFPILFGHFRLQSGWSNLMSPELSQSILSLTIATLFGVTTWIVAFVLNRRNEIQSEKERELAELNAKLSASLKTEAHLNEELQSSLEELTSSNEELLVINEQLEQAQQTIARQKDEQLNRVLDSSNDAIWSIDMGGGGGHYFSRSSSSLFGERLNSLGNDPFFLLQYVHADHVNLMQKAITQLKQMGKAECSCIINSPEGERWIRIQLRLIRNTDGDNIRLEGIANDITDLKRNQELLDQYRENLEIIFKNSSDNFVLIDEHAKLVLFNDGFKRFSHEMIEVEPRVNMTWYDVLPADRVEASKEIFQKVMNGERIDVVAQTILQGMARYFSLHFRPVFVGEKVKFITLSAFDVTEKKTQELKLEEYRQELEMVFNNSSDIFFLIDKSERLILFNKRLADYCQQVFGVVPAVGDSWHTVVTRDRISKYQEYTNQAFQGNSFDFLDKVETLVGTLFLSTHVRPISSQDEVTHVMVSITDRTAELQKEEEVQKYRENIEIIFQNATDFFALLNTKAEMLAFNRPLENYIRTYSKVEPRVGMSFYDIVAPNRVEAAQGLIQRALRGERVQVISESNFENEVRFYDVIYAPIIKDEVVTHVTITSTDITEKTKQEKLSGQYLDTLEIIFKTSQDTFLLVSAEGKVISFNEAFEKFIGEAATIKPVIGIDFLDVVVRDRQKTANALFKRALRNETVTSEVEFAGENGRLIQQLVKYEPVVRDGKVTHVSISGVDVTALKKTENELKRHQHVLETASSSAKIGYWTTERTRGDGEMTWSQEMFSIFQVNEKEFTGRMSFGSGFVHPDDREHLVKISEAAISRNQSYSVDHRLLLKNGTIKWVNDNASVIYDPVAKKEFIIGITQDITERKLAEEALREYHDRNEILFKATNDIMWDWDILNDSVYYNQNLRSALGYEERQISRGSRWWEERIHPEDHHRVTTQLKNSMDQKLQNIELTYRYRDQQGNYHYIQDRAFVVYNSAGKAIRLIGAMQDVTEVTEYRLELERKVAERTHELQEALAKEKESVEMQKRFVSIASHEFRTPLSTISLASGFIRKFLSKLSPDEVYKRLDNIETQVVRMNDMLKDVLTIGKIDAGKDEIQWRDFDLKELMESIVAEVANSVNGTHPIKFSLACSQTSFKTDESKIRNILINLLSNAVKFSKSDSEPVELEVSCQTDLVVIRVRDYGMGIPEHDVAKLFQPFYRASNVSFITGTGLGLSIVSRAVTALRGQIQVKSELTKGTEFIVTLPI